MRNKIMCLISYNYIIYILWAFLGQYTDEAPYMLLENKINGVKNKVWESFRSG